MKVSYVDNDFRTFVCDCNNFGETKILYFDVMRVHTLLYITNSSSYHS
jgi:hypothetical protein